MELTVSVAFIPLLFCIITTAVIIIINSKQQTQKTRKHTNTTTIISTTTPTYQQLYQQQYMPQFSQQMEIDLRLPYRRFKQIYPHSNITYEEYKKIQTQSAFKRSLSSKQNRRMVR